MAIREKRSKTLSLPRVDDESGTVRCGKKIISVALKSASVAINKPATVAWPTLKKAIT